MSDDFELQTLALHTGIHRSQFNEHSEALYLTSSFVFDSAAQAAAPAIARATNTSSPLRPIPRDRARRNFGRAKSVALTAVLLVRLSVGTGGR